MKDSILLSDLITKNVNELPEWINSKNVIYQIHNLINNKSYVGQAKWLYGRFVNNGKLSHKTCIDNYDISLPILYRAINKYGVENFEVLILETELNNLNSSEMYWISELHTYYSDPLGPGYNMTKGGEDCSQMNTLEVIKKRELIRSENRKAWLSIPGNKEAELEEIHRELDVQRRNHGGVLAWNTEEAVKHRIELHRERLKDPEYANSVKLRYKKIANTQRANHGGVLACNTPDARHKVSLKLMLNHITEVINNLVLNNKELTTYNYYKPDGPTSNWDYGRVIKKQYPYLNEFRGHVMWTSEMEQIFSGFKSVDGVIYVLDPSNNWIPI